MNNNFVCILFCMCRYMYVCINSGKWNCCSKNFAFVICIYIAFHSGLLFHITHQGLVEMPCFPTLLLAYCCYTIRFLSIWWQMVRKYNSDSSFWFYKVRLSSFSYAYEQFTFLWLFNYRLYVFFLGSFFLFIKF